MEDGPPETELIYLEFADALTLYAAIIGGTASQAADQLRDPGALESALSRPRSYAYYQDADLALQAAVLAHGIAETQTFIDANKRLALVAMLTFLELNGHRVEASDPELAGWIISLSAGTTPEQLALLVGGQRRTSCAVAIPLAAGLSVAERRI